MQKETLANSAQPGLSSPLTSRGTAGLEPPPTSHLRLPASPPKPGRSEVCATQRRRRREQRRRKEGLKAPSSPRRAKLPARTPADAPAAAWVGPAASPRAQPGPPLPAARDPLRWSQRRRFLLLRSPGAAPGAGGSSATWAREGEPLARDCSTGLSPRHGQHDPCQGTSSRRGHPAASLAVRAHSAEQDDAQEGQRNSFLCYWG